jgi:S1-C subfamily serine protease
VVAIVLVVMIAASAFLIGRATAPRHGPMHPRLRDDIQTSALTPTNAMTAAASTSPIPGVVDLNTVLSNHHEAAGTGIVLSADGLVLTNNHVVAGSTSINATDVDNGQSYQATVVGYDRSDDLAVVQLSGASGLPVAPLGNSSSVNPGDPVQAIGNAGGTGGQPAVASGTVVALNQPITAQDNAGSTERLTDLIEVNAPIQPGDSGGPLATTNGKVIGIDTAGTDNGPSTKDSATQGFAIPIDRATMIAGQITGGQASNTVHIGQSAFVGIQTVGSAKGGAPVVAVVPGGPAASTPLAAGDTIRAVDGQSIDSPDALSTVLDRHHPGDHVTIGWTTASGQAMTATVTLGTGPVG